MTFLPADDDRKEAWFERFKRFNWLLAFALCLLAVLGFVVLYSVGGGSGQPWALPQLQKFLIGLVAMLAIAPIPVSFWKRFVFPAYVACIGLLVVTELQASPGGSANRWLDLGFLRFQPSELCKLAIILVIATFYDAIGPERSSRPLWVAVPLFLIAVPVALIVRQPDLGTALLVVLGGVALMFVAGVSIYYFLGGGLVAIAGIGAALFSRGTSWQILEDYQYQRIETYLSPDPNILGSGYHITQSIIALGSGGVSGRGYLHGTQSQLGFLPERHTDFVFNTLGEEFGLVWGLILLLFYATIVGMCIYMSIRTRSRFNSLVIFGVGTMFFLYFSLNLAMVTGLTPVVGVPLPFISYSGSATLTLMIGFGLVQSAYLHDRSANG
ncbi:MAG: rod shape-determining protein RodA [Rhodobacteraceae bacterium]|nr:rod shape-determining protein RodA [Paracoccaceae bacterium]